MPNKISRMNRWNLVYDLMKFFDLEQADAEREADELIKNYNYELSELGGDIEELARDEENVWDDVSFCLDEIGSKYSCIDCKHDGDVENKQCYLCGGNWSKFELKENL